MGQHLWGCGYWGQRSLSFPSYGLEASLHQCRSGGVKRERRKISLRLCRSGGVRRESRKTFLLLCRSGGVKREGRKIFLHVCRSAAVRREGRKFGGRVWLGWSQTGSDLGLL